MENKADIIKDSVNPKGERVTSMVLKFPRIILAELNTHRTLSRNSASSRAIPFATMLESVKEDPFVPFRFQKKHSGMQGKDYFEEEDHLNCVADWLSARDKAVEAAINFKSDITKQLRNRLLEPFMWHTAIVTATDWNNFFALRAHEAAEIHIQDLAYKMMQVYVESSPQKLEWGEWHIPFVDSKINLPENIIESVASCARVSYTKHNGDFPIEKQKLIFESLKSDPMHASPFEHQAQANSEVKSSGNFRGGWQQFRAGFSNENKKEIDLKEMIKSKPEWISLK